MGQWVWVYPLQRAHRCGVLWRKRSHKSGATKASVGWNSCRCCVTPVVFGVVGRFSFWTLTWSWLCKGERPNMSWISLNRSVRHWYTDTDAQTQILGGSGWHVYESHAL